MKRYVFTDLACEVWDIPNRASSNRVFREKQISDGIRVSKGQIVRKEGMGEQEPETCATFFTPPLWQLDHRTFEELSEHIAIELRTMLQQATGRSALSLDFSALVVGVGNGEMTADALGPETAKHIFVTRHLGDARGAMGVWHCAVSAITPGVLGNTGIETVEVIRGAVQAVRPHAVIAVDALAARQYERLASTVQITDGGILPGSGIGTLRKAICRKTLGCPVIALGVPMVVNSSTLIAEVLRQDGVDSISKELQQTLENGKSFFVMLKESDQIVKSASLLLATAIDKACTVKSE